VKKSYFAALYLSERELKSLSSVLGAPEAYRKLSNWRKLDGFTSNTTAFLKRIRLEGLNRLWWFFLLGEKTPKPNSHTDLAWLDNSIKGEELEPSLVMSSIRRYAGFSKLMDRGLACPFQNQIAWALIRLEKKGFSTDAIDIFFSSQLGFLEQISRRAVILDLNIKSMEGILDGDNESDRFLFFKSSFSTRSNREAFFFKISGFAPVFF